jgi:Predicted hydrolases of HD superfamily
MTEATLQDFADERFKEPGYLPGSEGLSNAERRRLRYLEESARTLRWHTEPVLHRQTVGEHTYGVLMLVMELTSWQASRNLMAAALLHDTAERRFGDVPSPTKRLLELKESFDGLEETFMEENRIPLPALGKAEHRVLKIADYLEGAMFCAFETRRGNRDIRNGFRNYLNYLAGMNLTTLALDIYHELFKEYQRVFG